MKSLIYLGCVVAFLYLQSCGGGLIKHKDGDSSQTLTDTRSKTPVPVATSSLVINDEKDLTGYWVGKFEPDTTVKTVFVGERIAWDNSNKINISIDEIIGDSVSGP